jgi:hypothetical protein
MNKHHVHRLRRRDHQHLRDTPDRRRAEDIPDHRDALVPAARVHRGGQEPRVDDPAAQQSEASGILSARRKFAGSAWTSRTTLTTSGPKFWRRSCKSEGKFFLGA